MAFPTRFATRVLGVVLLALAPGSTFAASEPSAPPSAPPAEPIMTVDEIKPGMKGVGYSVFSHAGRVSFEAEIIDVLKNSGPRRDLILAELRGDTVEEAGIIAGMSGSPVYIDGRLIGAVAYGWSFSKRPIAGITPIAEMLEVMNAPEPEEDRAHAIDPALPMPAVPPGNAAFGDAHGDPFPSTSEVISRLSAAPPATTAGDGLVPLRVPIVVSGLSGTGVDALRRALAPLHLEVVEGVSGIASTSAGGVDDSGDLGPGDPVSIPLARGDASIAAFGTVTYNDGTRLIAFGHPVFHTGGQRLPLASGRVIGVLPSQSQSFKFFTASEPVGYFFADQTPGVAGRLGNPPRMLPVTLALESPSGVESFQFDVARDYFLTAPIIQALVGGTVSAHAFKGGLGTITTDVTMHLKDGSTVDFHDVVATLSPSDQTALQTSAPISLLFGNPYGEPAVERVELAARIENDVRFSAIDAVEILDQRVRPGDTLHLRMILRPYRGQRREELVSIDVPPSMPIGKAILRVADRVSMDDWDRERAPEKFRPANLGAFLDRLRDLPAHNEIEVRLYVAGSSFVVSGEEMPPLPPSVRRALGSVQTSGPRAVVEGVEVASRTVELDGHVLGSHTLSLEVENR